MSEIKFCIITVSDTCYDKTKEDTSGPALAAAVLSSFPNAQIISSLIIPDEETFIQATLRNFCNKCDVILTTGGTGFSPRDVTPEATKAVIEKEAPGIAYAMISKSLAITDMAMVSRSVCGIKGKTLIINLPGSNKGSTECFEFVKVSIPHAVALLNGDQEKVNRTHRAVQNECGESKVKTNDVANRNRKSPYPMLEVEDACDLIVAKCHGTQEIEVIDIENSLNRILAEDIFTQEPFPPFSASIKDGYAVKFSDGSGIRTVRDVIAAGDKFTTEPLKNREIIRISTGAPIPLGADAVVQVEDTELVESSEDGCKEVRVMIKVAPQHGQDIREIGSDLPSNTLVLQTRTKVTPGIIGILATIGKIKVSVYKRPSIGVISTGNELQRHDEQLRPGHIRDSNKLTLLNLLKQYNYPADDCGIAKDEPNCVKRALMNALSRHDVVVTTGGVSMGEFDLIKEVLKQDFDATIHFGRVNMKPGKPTTFATCQFDGKLKVIFGLPGNPVSAMVTCKLFLLPALGSLENKNRNFFLQIPVLLGDTVKLDERQEYKRVNFSLSEDNKYLVANTTGNQISSRLNSFVGATGLLCLPPKVAHSADKIEKGQLVKAELIDLEI